MKKIISFILSTACLLFSACSLNEISSQNNNSSTNAIENNSNPVSNSNSTPNSELPFESENTENNLTNSSSFENNNCSNNPFEIEGLVFGGYTQPDVSGDPLPSSMIAYRVQEFVLATDTYVSFEIAISDVSFTRKEPIRYQEPMSHLTITVANLTNEAEETVLETLTQEFFSSQSYGYQIVKDEKDNKWISYDNYVVYNIPSTLLSGEKGILLFKVTQYYPPNSWDCATAVVYYKYQDGKIYFSTENM